MQVYVPICFYILKIVGIIFHIKYSLATRAFTGTKCGAIAHSPLPEMQNPPTTTKKHRDELCCSPLISARGKFATAPHWQHPCWAFTLLCCFLDAPVGLLVAKLLNKSSPCLYLLVGTHLRGVCMTANTPQTGAVAHLPLTTWVTFGFRTFTKVLPFALHRSLCN